MAYVVNELDGTVTTFARDRRTGALTRRGSAAASTEHAPGGAAAADIHLTPDGRLLYASVRSDSHIAAFAVGADGALTSAGRFPVEAAPRSFAIDPGGRWLVCAGRDAAAFGVYEIDRATGALAARGRVATGENPNWVEIVTVE
jgi:6-phosphogluconolactonase